MMTIFYSLSYFSLHSAVFLLLLIFHSFSFRHPLCRDNDRSSLLEFKRIFVFNTFSCDPSANFTKLSSWNVGVDCCLWDGVECNVETGHVTGLDLSSSCLFGSINSSSPLFRLVHLKSLDLSYNNFNLSAIPRAIRSLSRLKHLNLTSSNFIGQIPAETLQLTNLVSLDLSSNPLVLRKPNLKDVVETFTRLGKLDLSGVSISSHVPQSLSNLTSLSSLVLINCSLLGEFPSDVFQLPKLHVLALPHNPNLTGYLPEFDNASSPLEMLWLDGTSFSGELPVSIGKLKSLGVFAVAECRFGGVIPSSIGNLTNLHGLDLSGNYFSGRIPSSLGNLCNLTYLDLSFNNFSSGNLNWIGALTDLKTLEMSETNTFGAIPLSIQNLTQLTALLLYQNQLTGQIASWIGNFTRLVKLSLAANELEGPIPESLFRIPNLQALDMQDNNLRGSLKYDSFLQMQHLSFFQVSNNHLSFFGSSYKNLTLPKFHLLGLNRCNLREFPAFLRSQNELESLFLSSNNIEGYVPNWLFSLESLIVLVLANNSLTGFQKPLGVLSLPSLRVLSLTTNRLNGPLPFPPHSIIVYDVSQNNFSGHISHLFCNLTVFMLDLSSNNLSGSLPPCLGNSASVLNLRNNSLSGEIPNTFTSGCKLKRMDFSRNKFRGALPNLLSKCFELEILDLDENRMNDVFPSWLGMLPHLRILSLRSNQFHGEIRQPKTKFEFSRLQIIDLSCNNFRGKLPLEYFQNWVSMKSVDKDHLAYMQIGTKRSQMLGYSWTFDSKYSITIVNKGTEREYDHILEFFVVVDLSSNKFEGGIPEIFGTLRALQSLNLSNNMLTGHIPSSLGNLTMLEALDLSRNGLSGQIPNQLTWVTSLAVFNVSHNNLTGPIPRANQFGTFDNSSFSDNPGLCGDILPKQCGKTETSQLPPSNGSEEDDDSPFQFNLEIVSIGFGSGLVIGVAFGWALDTRKYEWLVKKKFARRVRRRRRN